MIPQSVLPFIPIHQILFIKLAPVIFHKQNRIIGTLQEDFWGLAARNRTYDLLFVPEMSPSRTGQDPWDGLESNSSEMSDFSSASESETEAVNFGNHPFFEGVEKLLEVWFTNKSGDISGCDLRKIPRFVCRSKSCPVS